MILYNYFIHSFTVIYIGSATITNNVEINIDDNIKAFHPLSKQIYSGSSYHFYDYGIQLDDNFWSFIKTPPNLKELVRDKKAPRIFTYRTLEYMIRKHTMYRLFEEMEGIFTL